MPVRAIIHAIVPAAVVMRREEFATVRRCARAALLRLGAPVGPILPGERGAPQWPAGVVGSMTHCTGYAAAAVARTSDAVALGIDAEPNEPLPEDVLRLVTDRTEREMIGRLSARAPDVCADRILFSAKESVYKAWYPMTGSRLDFHDVRVEIRPDLTSFVAYLVPGPVVAGRQLTALHGRCAVGAGLAVTAVAVPAATAAR